MGHVIRNSTLSVAALSGFCIGAFAAGLNLLAAILLLFVIALSVAARSIRSRFRQYADELQVVFRRFNLSDVRQSAHVASDSSARSKWTAERFRQFAEAIGEIEAPRFASHHHDAFVHALLAAAKGNASPVDDLAVRRVDQSWRDLESRIASVLPARSWKMERH